MDNFPRRIDRLLNSISNVYMSDQESLGALLDKKTFRGSSVAPSGTTFVRSGALPDPGVPPGGAKPRSGSLAKVHTH